MIMIGRVLLDESICKTVGKYLWCHVLIELVGCSAETSDAINSLEIFTLGSLAIPW